MSDNEHSDNLKVKSTQRFHKPPFLRNFGHFTRGRPGRPAFPSKRRHMSGRYPNRGFRPFSQPGYRQEYPIPRGFRPDFRQRFPANLSAPGFTPPNGPRPPFPTNMPTNNVFNTNTNQLPVPQPATFGCGNNQVPMQSPEQRNQFNMSSDLWIETLSPDGKKYYFNARTRQTVWTRPINARVIDLDEINRLKTCSRGDFPQNLPDIKNNPFVQQQQQQHPYTNQFIPRNGCMQPRFVVFPPPQNMCHPPPILPPSAEHIQVAISYNFNTMVPPSVMPMTEPTFRNPLSAVGENLMPMTKCSDSVYSYNTGADLTCREVGKDRKQKSIDNSVFECRESKKSDWDASESMLSLSSAGDVKEVKSSRTADESVLKHEAFSLEKVKIEHEALDDNFQMMQCSEDQNDDDRNSITPTLDEINYEEPAVENRKDVEEQREGPTDKTRPVSSTPVSGTAWSVVWTGDERVFFYDSQNKVSIWERPVDLINRTDVDKLVEKSPLSVGVKSDKKEARKITSDGSDVVKKLKTEAVGKTDAKIIKNQGEVQTTQLEKDKEMLASEIASIPHEKKVKIFCEMLGENKVSPSSSWKKELHKIVYDPRYLLLPSKERRQVFDAYISRKREEEKNKIQKELHNRKKKFIDLLQEAGITSNSRFYDFSIHYGKDERFKSVERLRQRESMFNEYVSELKKKERAKDKLKAEQRKKFLELLKEQNFLKNDVKWTEVQGAISKDVRYQTIKDNSLKEKIFQEYIRNRNSSVPLDEKERRISASLRNREEEVKRDLSVHLKNREIEQEHHRNEETVTNFKALLNDLIRNPDTDWNSARKMLKRDNRWRCALQRLEGEKRKELFEEHIGSLNSRKSVEFHRMLDEMPEISLKSSWLDVRNLVMKHPGCAKFSTSERKCEAAFKEYLKLKLINLKKEFKELLRETKLISYKSKSLLGTTSHLKEIEEALSQDKRYLNLDCMRSERKEILLSYINALHNKGPPPPPTSSDNSHRFMAYK